MALSSKKTTSSSLERDTYDNEWTKTIDANSFLAEERRLLKTKRHSVQNTTMNQLSQKRFSKFNYRINQMTSEQLNEELKERQLSTSGEIEIRRVRLKKFHKHGLIGESANSVALLEQNFEYIAVVDFEATCEEIRQANYSHEIIEFPIVLIDVQQQAIIDKFQSYCRPTIKPILSRFCTELTGIEQDQVDNAPTFVQVLRNVEIWFSERNLLPLSSSSRRRLAFATDGPWDFVNFLRMQCDLSSISYPQWAEEWINVRKLFASFYSVPRCGIKSMLQKLGLSFDGRPHSGLDDATNIARIVIELLKDGCILLFNDGIRTSTPKFVTMTSKKSVVNDNNEEEDNLVVFED